jgi:hypothetical protein
MDTPTQPIVAVIHTRMQPPGVLQQVTIRPDKLKKIAIEQVVIRNNDPTIATSEGTIIRLGETPGDEYMGWVRLEDIELVAVLGRAITNGKEWSCIPETQDALDSQTE